jgi:hypothetical protein
MVIQPSWPVVAIRPARTPAPGLMIAANGTSLFASVRQRLTPMVLANAKLDGGQDGRGWEQHS